jgi:hypothetical protein
LEIKILDAQICVDALQYELHKINSLDQTKCVYSGKKATAVAAVVPVRSCLDTPSPVSTVVGIAIVMVVAPFASVTAPAF